jgi:predicted permease
MGPVTDVLWQVIAPVFLAAGLGFLLARAVGLKAQDLSRVAFYLLSPCLVFDKLSHSALSPGDLGRLVAFAVLTIVGSLLIAWILASLLRFEQAATSAFMLVVFAGNTGNYGLAANQFAFGSAALEPAIVYFAISTLFIATVGVYLVTRGRRSAANALRNVLTVPLTYAAVGGLLAWALDWQLPLPLDRAVGLVGQAAVPVMLIVLGIQLADIRQMDHPLRIAWASATKLIAVPLLGVLVASLLGLTGLNRQVGILQTAMPTAVMTTILTTVYDVEPGLAAGTVLATTLGSLVTVTLVLTFLT